MKLEVSLQGHQVMVLPSFGFGLMAELSLILFLTLGCFLREPGSL